MSVSGISGTSFFNTQSQALQNQQQWQQELQKLTRASESGSLSSPGATADAQPAPQSDALPTTQNTKTGSPLLNPPQGTPKHSLNLRHPHHLHVGAGNHSEENTGPSVETANSQNASTEQAFNSWQQNLQQVALNADLLSAQSSDWEPVSLSA